MADTVRAGAQAWKALALCDLASDWLAARYPDALIVRELSVGKWGKALIDIAAITPEHIIGVEIKGEGDSGARLELQGHMYSRVATHMFLLTAPALDKIAEKHLPAGWWHLRVGGAGIDGGRLDRIGYPGALPEAPERLPNAPAQILECLITRELKFLARILCPAVDHGRCVATMIHAISENASLSKVRRGVCTILRERDWLAYDRSTGRNRDARYRWADGSPVAPTPHRTEALAA